MNQTVTTKSIKWQDLLKDEDADTISQIVFQMTGESSEVFGHGAMITETMEVNGWILKPRDSYAEIIPEEGLAILKKIEESVELAGVVIADDKRKVKPDFYENDRAILKIDQVVKILGIVAIAFIAALAAVIVITAILLTMGVVLMIAMIFISLLGLTIVPMGVGALTFDPAIVCVTKSGTWIRIFEW